MWVPTVCTHILVVMVILSCQLDCIWNELQSRHEGHLGIQILRQEDTMPLLWIVMLEATGF